MAEVSDRQSAVMMRFLMRNMALPLDTTIEAARVQAAVWQRMPMEMRLKLALEMIEHARSLAESGVRWRHPEYSDDQVRLAAIRLRLGEELYRKAYPGQDVRP